MKKFIKEFKEKNTRLEETTEKVDKDYCKGRQ